MIRFRHSRPRSSPAFWLALIAMLLQLLLPSLAAAANAAARDAAGGGRQTIEICSPQGIAKLVIDADGQPVPQAAAHANCPCCLAGNCGAASVPAATILALVEAPRAPATGFPPQVRPDLPADALRAWLSRLYDGPPAA